MKRAGGASAESTDRPCESAAHADGRAAAGRVVIPGGRGPHPTWRGSAAGPMPVRMPVLRHTGSEAASSARASAGVARGAGGELCGRIGERRHLLSTCSEVRTLRDREGGLPAVGGTIRGEGHARMAMRVGGTCQAGCQAGANPLGEGGSCPDVVRQETIVRPDRGRSPSAGSRWVPMRPRLRVQPGACRSDGADPGP